MPYFIKPVGNRFKVCDQAGKCFSNRGLTKKTAQKQRIAIALSESRKTGKDVGAYFAPEPFESSDFVTR